MTLFAANALQYIVNGEETPKIAPFPLGFRHLVGGRATAIGNMHKKFGKDRDCGSGDILSDRQTDAQTLLITILCHRTRRRSKYVK